MTDPLSKEAYLLQFSDKKVKKNALERAWKNRDFEIEHYWKRATYFWAFIAGSFAGYFAIISSNAYNQYMKKDFPQVQYLVICLGLVFSVAWLVANYGSKRWQENWERHIDLLEDEITGPIYKTILNKNSYSVSKINILVSWFVVCIWIILGFNYFYHFVTFRCCETCRPDLIVISSTFATFFFLLIMTVGWGRTKSSKDFNMVRREVNYKD